MAQGEWADGFGLPGLDRSVHALTFFDDGTGPALYAGGSFTTTGIGFDVTANRIAKWNGSTWSPLGSGINIEVLALTGFDDGTGPALYAGGFFTTAGGVSANHIAKWNGSAWSPLGSGTNDTVLALAVFDDGTGPALYAGGEFTTTGGSSTNRIAKWNGAAWSPLGSGMSGTTFPKVDALTVFDDGTGPALYAGGEFTMAGGVSATSIAKWDGSTWSPLGSGIRGGVTAITVFDDGNGTALYVGGGSIAKWDGSTWSPLGIGTDGPVLALAVFDDGASSALYAGGFFTKAGGVTANNIAKWNGSTWLPPGGAGLVGRNPVVHTLTVLGDGTGAALYAGGSFSAAGGVITNNIAKWNGSAWSALDAGLSNGLNGSVGALTIFDNGTGPALYAGGSFDTAGGISAANIARWNGSAWSPLGSGINTFGVVVALTVFDDGSGTALYAGGSFTSAGGVDANYIAKWNGSDWSPLGSGIIGSGFVPGVFALTVFDDGTGRALYAGGDFTFAGGSSANYIAKWNGSVWSPLGSGVNAISFLPSVYALTVFDDGTGPALYVGGDFASAGGVRALFIAKWNGSTWSPLGSGMSLGTSKATVRALAVFDDGTGPALYAGGIFSAAGGTSANKIGKWDGTAWSALDSEVGPRFGSSVLALTVFGDGTGPALYAGGLFETAGSVSAMGIAKWNGSTWSALDAGLNKGVNQGVGYALTVFDDGTGPALYTGGGFATAGGKASSNIAAWRPDCNGNGIPNGCDVECGVACAAWSDLPGCGASADCNANRIPDECELASSAGRDCNANGRLDVCDLPGDVDGNDVVDLGDGRIFGGCVTGPGVSVDALDVCRCDDLNGDGFVDLRDAAEFVAVFGSSR